MNNGPYLEFIKDYVDEDEVRAFKHTIMREANHFHRFELVSASRRSSICSPRSQKVCAQLAWQLSAAHTISSFVCQVWVICRRGNGKLIPLFSMLILNLLIPDSAIWTTYLHRASQGADYAWSLSHTMLDVNGLLSSGLAFNTCPVSSVSLCPPSIYAR